MSRTAAEGLGYHSALSLAAMVQSRELSPVEIFDALAERILARNPILNAFTYLALDEAREAARAAERAVMAGGPLPPLHGVPTAIKDLFDSKPGWPMTIGGISALRDNRGTFSCPWCSRIEAAGAIVVGKTNSPAFGFRGVTDNKLFGPTRNPFDLSRNSGGSSGGAAAAVAGGLLPFAEATDAGGSIRIPSSWCGAFGHKPTFGLVPLVVRPVAFIGDAPYPSEGAITRTVSDAAAILDLQAGPDRRDPQGVPELATDFLALSGRGVRGLRVALSVDLGSYPVDPRVAERVRRTAGLLEVAGAIVEEIEVDLGVAHDELTSLWQRAMTLMTVPVLDQLAATGIDLFADHPDDVPDEVAQWLEIVLRQDARDRIRDAAARTRIFDGVETVFADYDLFVSATTATTASLNSSDAATLTRGPSSVGGQEIESTIGWALTPVFNFTGHPAASVPAGLIDGLPVGMQIAGRRFKDGEVLAAARVIEEAQPWAGSYERELDCQLK